ncbi:STAS domain-containing protein [Streptomyces sp. NPDC056254]|uniref:STAS domain-containing protein n=1 Tax=Streptomyces sp. NPDC056254 TaxID=3345763 RepID=UPI0035E21D38
MATDAYSAATHAPVMITADGGCTQLVFTGRLGAADVLRLEQALDDRRLAQAHTWLWDMAGLIHIDLICAYALLRAIRRTATGPVRIRGARRPVERTLRHTGMGAVADIHG